MSVILPYKKKEDTTIFSKCAFLVVRSHIQTHEQNIQIGRQAEAGKMMVPGRHETRK